MVKPEPEKLEAVEQFQLPETKTQVQSFLGLTGYYHRFIPNYATIAVPLTNLTKKCESERVKWTIECDTAFSQVLLSNPVLHSVDFSKPFILQVDASDVGVGAVLSQLDDHLVAYCSRKLLPREQKCSVIEKECLAIKLSVEAFQVYLLGREFLIETDHRALQWLANFHMSNCGLTRWSLALQPFNFRVRHRRGCENANADAHSQLLAKEKEGGM